MSTLPAPVLRWLEERYGSVRVDGAVGGGCVNPAVRVRLGGQRAFLKYNPAAPATMFEVEAEALRALGAAGARLRVPQVLGVWQAERAGEGPACLLLEWLEPGAPGAGFWERLGGGLAELHRTRGARWGWPRDGFIGPLPQPNVGEPPGEEPCGWAEFWRGYRLEPQLRRARDAGWRVGREAEWEQLWRRLPELLAPAAAEGPSLLHGDLWSGNVLPVVAHGGAEPALVDPAAYHGHREVDLAMAGLFGGFPASFFDAYREAWPLQPGYRPGRCAVYQLFYLLVHVNLFGAGYLSRTEQALRSALGAG